MTLVFLIMPGRIRVGPFPNRVAARAASEAVPEGAQETAMSLRVIFDTCEPREEVLRGL